MNKHPFNRATQAPKVKHPLYNRWNNLKQYINNPNHANYHRYGGNNIGMDKEWEKSFIVFFLWATQNGYKSDLVITRKDKSKGFEPTNCFFGKHSYDIED
jgi:hypothetical protein